MKFDNLSQVTTDREFFVESGKTFTKEKNYKIIVIRQLGYDNKSRFCVESGKTFILRMERQLLK